MIKVGDLIRFKEPCRWRRRTSIDPKIGKTSVTYGRLFFPGDIVLLLSFESNPISSIKTLTILHESTVYTRFFSCPWEIESMFRDAESVYLNKL